MSSRDARSEAREAISEGLNPKRWKNYYAYPKQTADQQWSAATGNAGKEANKPQLV